MFKSVRKLDASGACTIFGSLYETSLKNAEGHLEPPPFYPSSVSCYATTLAAITITERVSSAVSVIASCIIIATFIWSKSFRKPINRLVFYATFGNILSNAGTLVSQSGIQSEPQSSLCQFQGFAIQWFMPADSLWAFTMACNVYLALFHHYNTQLLRPLEWKYFLFCYGVPFIPAFVFLFVKTESQGRIYGPAIQWCWVSLKWDWLQIALFYGPVWFILLLTWLIYLRVGLYILLQRRRLNKYINTDSTIENPLSNFEESGINLQGLQEAHQQKEEDQEQQEEEYQQPQQHSQQELSTFQAHESFSSNEPPADVVGAPNLSAPEAVAARAYCKYALLFFIALLITWVPSSANRVYALCNSNRYIFGLTYASSLVLPLQGFWNAVIYITVSWESMKTLPSQISHSDPHAFPPYLARKLSGISLDTRFVRRMKGLLGYQRR